LSAPDTNMVRERSKLSGGGGFAVAIRDVDVVSAVELRVDDGGHDVLGRDEASEPWRSVGEACLPFANRASDVLRWRFGVLPTIETTYSQCRLRLEHRWHPVLSPLHRIYMPTSMSAAVCPMQGASTQ
jgi:hypothetical protein